MTEQATSIVVSYPLTPEQINEQLGPLLAAEKPTEVVKAIAVCRGLRGQIEDRRQLLKADSLDYGRRVDGAAKQLTALVERYENQLKERKAQHDAEKARAKAAAEQAERDRLMAAEREKLAAERAEAQRHIDAENERRAAEEKQLAQKRADLQRERAEHERQQAEERAKMKAEREAIMAQVREAEEARQRAQATLDKIEAANRAEQTRARMAAEAEEQRQEKEKHDAEVAAKVAAAQPDIVKLRAWADRISGIRQQAPSCADPDAGALVESVCNGLSKLCWHLAGFDGSPQELTYPPLHTTVFGEWVDANEH